MKFVQFHHQDQTHLGVVKGDQVVNLRAAAPELPSDLMGFIKTGGDIFEQAEKAANSAKDDDLLPLKGLEFDIPIAGSGKILCLGLNFAKHAAEGGFTPPDFPIVFMRAPTSLVAHGQNMLRPVMSHTLDYEAELAVIIGTGGHHISLEDALDHVAGYSCFNDGSVREYQRRTSQWTLGKNFDKTGGFGPYFVTTDEVPPGAKGIQVTSRLNGEIMQNANTDDMIFPVAQTIHLLSQSMTLEAGDVIVMGTCEGVGFARTPPVWLKHGDIIEVEIEGVGTLINPVVDETA